MVNMPCAMTSGSPTSLANFSFQWIGLKSPEAPAYWTSVARRHGEGLRRQLGADLDVVVGDLRRHRFSHASSAARATSFVQAVTTCSPASSCTSPRMSMMSLPARDLIGLDGRGDRQPVTGPHRAGVGELLVAVHHPAVVQPELRVLDDLARRLEGDREDEGRRGDHIGVAERLGRLRVGVRGVGVPHRLGELADLLPADLIRGRWADRSAPRRTGRAPWLGYLLCMT